MLAYKLALVVLASLLCQSNGLEYPGTLTRPVLSDSEASQYTIANYFGDWTPEEIVIPDQPDYVVAEGQSIQAAVNEAIRNGSSAVRTYIKIEAGHYMETVYITGDVPLTIYGDLTNSENVHIMSNISADTSVADYVNENGDRYQEGDPAWDVYNSCASQEGTIGYECATVFLVQSSNFQLKSVTIHNGASHTQAQGIAIRTAGDKIHLMNNRFLGIHDSVSLGLAPSDVETVERVYVHRGYIEGETDYVIGSATVVLNSVSLNTVASLETDDLIVFSPLTTPRRTYGFLVIEANITGDASYLASNKVHLARAWDHGITSPDEYLPGVSPNGQLVIRDSLIANVINVVAPYGPAVPSGRNFTTDISTNRNLDDNTHNKFWEYNNRGAGAP